MTFAEEKGRAEARRQDRIARAQDKHLAAHRALAQRHATEPRVGNYYAQYARQTEERKKVDDALGDEVRQADEAFYADLARLGLNTYVPHERK